MHSHATRGAERRVSDLPVDPLCAEHYDVKPGERCKSCWSGYATLCACGGTIHSEFGDYVSEGFYLEQECDGCDDPEDDC